MVRRFEEMAFYQSLSDLVGWVGEHFMCFPRLNDVSFVHDNDLIGDVLNDTDLLRHVNKRNAHLFLHF